MFPEQFRDGTGRSEIGRRLVEIPDDQYPTGVNWVSQDANLALPAAVNGQANVKIAFKYVSTSTWHGTWQIKDVTIAEQ